jgi:AraC-like DNA-binding protein
MVADDQTPNPEFTAPVASLTVSDSNDATGVRPPRLWRKMSTTGVHPELLSSGRHEVKCSRMITNLSCHLLRNFISDVARFAEPHIGAPGQQAGDDRAVVRLVFDVASEYVLEGVHEPALLMHEMHDAPDLHLPELFKEWMIHGLTATGILEGPANMGPPSCDLHVLVLARSNTLIDLSDSRRKIAEVSDALGFPHQSHFTTTFHTLVGMTLGEYRRQRSGR